ncbi:MAG: hypothetical protein LUP97_03215, partial [Methanoregula sp.]|nr:hypothetical protein [Methanoregula sp.]
IDDDLFRFDRFRIFVWEGIKKKLKAHHFCGGSPKFGLTKVGLIDDESHCREENLEKYWIHSRLLTIKDEIFHIGDLLGGEL